MKNKMIKGMRADYCSRWYFVWKGVIYSKLRADTAYQRGYQYPAIDIVKKNQQKEL
ncbi:hypothetical protein [Helicobacter sp. 13S00477-4]|uniref:hypothetical protein n=1 Tax=Helicobacter sp. 13S00477-4 TaxID=1905759 RepID=UPI0015DB9800|nr:hypothetical protein [Helicobacter sp. 13S00477-4]